MRSNFDQPQGAPHAGVFRHYFTPTDAERIARARGWLAAGGTLVRADWPNADLPSGHAVCWWARDAEGRCLDGLAAAVAEAVVEGLEPETRPFSRPEVTVYRRREG